MEVQTTRFGQIETIEVPDELVIEFPHGLPGFEHQKSFALIEDARYLPLLWLQAIGDPSVQFVAIDPTLIRPDYQVDVTDLDVECLELNENREADLLCILVTQGDPRATTVNLKAPLVINRQARRGKQVILTDERYPLRYRAFPAGRLQASAATPC